MKLIVGLGNPGSVYKFTRHNAGVLGVEKLARKNKLNFEKSRSFKSLLASGVIKGRPVVLILPQIFMNLSGEAVQSVVNKKRIALEDILIVCDDVALPLGVIKIKPSGSDGGHNGLASVIERLGTKDFARLRIGVDRCVAGNDLAEYVLSNFDKAQRPVLEDILEKSAEAMEIWICEGIEKSMNRCNSKNNKEKNKHEKV